MTNYIRQRNVCRLQRGISLIEVAIAVLVISVGVIGLASLQLSAKRAGFEAVQRTTAAALANDIIERMRNNPTNLLDYDEKELGGGSIATAPTPDCRTASCSGAQLASRDLWEWEQTLDGANERRSGADVGGLNDAAGCIDTNLGGIDGRILVTISWEGYMDLSKVDEVNTCGNESSLRRQLLVVQSFISKG